MPARMRIALLAALALFAGLPLLAAAQSPQGLLVDDAGDVWVIDTGVGGEEQVRYSNPETEGIDDETAGESALVQRIEADGTITEEARFTSVSSGSEFVGGARLALADGELYATIGGWAPELEPEEGPIPAGVYRIADGGAEMVAEIWTVERDQNPDGTLLDSHPYGLASSPTGRLWATDAGGNALYLVDPAQGRAQAVTAFEPLPGAFPSDAYETLGVSRAPP